jgi:hypothetical protein
MFILFQKLANMRIVGLEPVLDSGGICFIILGLGRGALASALGF